MGSHANFLRRQVSLSKKRKSPNQKIIISANIMMMDDSEQLQRGEAPRQVFRLVVPREYLNKLKELGIERFGIDPENWDGANVWQSYDYDSDTAGIMCELNKGGEKMVLRQRDVQPWDLQPSNTAYLVSGSTYSLGPAVIMERKWRPTKGRVTGAKCLEHMFGLWEAFTEPPMPLNHRLG